jgi:hypothetical protein
MKDKGGFKFAPDSFGVGGAGCSLGIECENLRPPNLKLTNST